MADLPLPFVPYNSEVIDENGFLSTAWSAFYRALYIRVGQANALTNIELAALANGNNFQTQINTLSASVTANKADADLQLSNLAQGPVL